jgi:hypothetical protein
VPIDRGANREFMSPNREFMSSNREFRGQAQPAEQSRAHSAATAAKTSMSITKPMRSSYRY